MQTIIGHLRRDEARHIAYGVFLLSRLIAEHGDEVWNTVEERLNELLPLAMGIVGEVFEPYAEPPFGLRIDEFAEFAMSQFGKRAARLEKARGQTLADVLGTPLETEEAAA
jgi:ribonucleoside-diphosphate reductase beta chain